jgi:hypothetical protein
MSNRQSVETGLEAEFADANPSEFTLFHDVPVCARRNRRDFGALDFPRSEWMSKEKPADDPRERTDWKSPKQTDEPWKGPVEKEQKPRSGKPDLERWHDSDTH